MQEFGVRTPTPAREMVIDCLRAGVEAVLPGRVVREPVPPDSNTLTVADKTYDLSAYDRILVVGGGKAGGGVADALEAVLGDRIDDGVVVTPDPTPSPDGRIRRLPGDHPIPPARGVESTRRPVDLFSDPDDRTLVLAAITGGASVVPPVPAESISLVELQETTDRLLESGAEIHDLNTVRKHVSTLKGSGLARLAAPATVIDLVLSNAVGNDLGVIASGPTAPGETTYDDALDVLDRFDFDVPKPVRTRLTRGSTGDVPETPKPDDPVFDRMTNHVLADAFTALDAARKVADDRRYEPLILSSRVRGEAREVAKTHVAVAGESSATGNPIIAPAVVLLGDECTVTVRGDGDGGLNLEFCLTAVTELLDEIVLASIDSDGKDGGTEVAGAVVDASSVIAGDAHAALARNDAFPVLRETGALVESGATGMNVNDLRVLVVSEGV